MLSSFRPAFWIFVGALALSAAPAHAVDAKNALAEVRADAGQAGGFVAAFVHAVAVGHMASIQKTTFAFSGFIAAIGLWLLIVRPRLVVNQERVIQADAIAAAVPTESDADRPARLLEAIAAAKAQMSISEAEKKHSH